MAKLFIAEKPSVGRAIAQALGVAKMQKTHCETKSGDCVTWCFGHLMEQAEPDAYLPDDIPKTKKGAKIWREQDLPIIPKIWKMNVKSDCKAQFSQIGKLLKSKQFDTVVNCGDPDREGQLLVDEILEHYKNKKKVLRYWSSAVDPASVKKGLQTLKPNEKFAGMKFAALGRSHADWLIGMNGTRAFTLAAGKARGERVLLSVGRVQTPTLNLVAQRDYAIKNFKPIPYYVIKGQFIYNGESFTATLKTKAGQPGCDEEGRLVDINVAKQLIAIIKNQRTAVVRECTSKEKLIQPPLGYSLADIQNEGNRKYSLSAQDVLDVCQSLYEKHKLTTYPRSDCEYLPEVQHQDSPAVLKAIMANNQDLAALIKRANPSLKSRIFNDAKISAHHAIIPTSFAGDTSALSDSELKIYKLIVKRYLCQFFAPQKVNSTNMILDVGGLPFTCSGNVTLEPGWKIVYGKEDDEEKEESQQTIPLIKQGQTVDIGKLSAAEEKTKAPAAFTEGSLIKAMENIYTVVEDPRFKKLLKDGDGIGTSATRAAIITELKRKGYLELKKKKLSVTPLGLGLLNSLPDLCKNPVLTAMFESELKKVESGEKSVEEFELKQQSFVKTLIETAQKQSYKF